MVYYVNHRGRRLEKERSEQRMTDSEKIDLILSEMVGMKSDMQGMKKDMQGMKDDIQGMKDDIQGMKDESQGMKDDIRDMKKDIHHMKEDIQDLKQRVTSIEVHLENVTDKNIQIIAEGHLDLSRKLDEALKVENEKELLLIRVGIVEDDVRKIKEQQKQTA